MENDDNQFWDDRRSQDFDGVTLQIGVDDRNSNITKPNYSNVDLKDTDTLLNGNIPLKHEEQTSDKPCKERPSTLAIVPWAGQSAKDFFSYRDGLVNKAIEETTKEFLIPGDDILVGTWLLTEVSSWDHERERLVILTSHSLLIVKYDFIALKILDNRRIPISIIDGLIIGELSYPPASLIKHLDGFATGISSVVKDCVLRPLQEKIAGMPACTATVIRNSYFEPRSRNMSGVRILWNKGMPLSFSEKWNPFEKEIPFVTFISHPLLWHKDGQEGDKKIYNVDDLTDVLKQSLEKKALSFQCSIQHKPIMIENYVGVTSLIHNKNSLGFFKVRGKFSF